MFPWIACHSRHGSLNTSERRQSLWCQPATIIAHSLLQERSFWRKCVVVVDREPNWNNARSIDFIPFGPFSRVFIRICHAFYFIHFCRAFSYATKMRFHHQLVRLHKTAVWLRTHNRFRKKQQAASISSAGLVAWVGGWTARRHSWPPPRKNPKTVRGHMWTATDSGHRFWYSDAIGYWQYYVLFTSMTAFLQFTNILCCISPYCVCFIVQSDISIVPFMYGILSINR